MPFVPSPEFKKLIDTLKDPPGLIPADPTVEEARTAYGKLGALWWRVPTHGCTG